MRKIDFSHKGLLVVLSRVSPTSSMNCVGKSADRRLAHVSFHLDERGGSLELLQCGETGLYLYECRPGSLHRVFELGEFVPPAASFAVR